MGTHGLVAMTSAPHAEGRQLMLKVASSILAGCKKEKVAASRNRTTDLEDDKVATLTAEAKLSSQRVAATCGEGVPNLSGNDYLQLKTNAMQKV